MGLIAREIEARGIPTLSLTSALSITRAVNPPRAAFVDFPLGHTAGKAHESELQRRLLVDALHAFESVQTPGGLVHLPYKWAEDDSWKEQVMRADPTANRSTPTDDRTARDDAPQYQTEEDRLRAEEMLAAGDCETCVFLEAPQLGVA